MTLTEADVKRILLTMGVEAENIVYHNSTEVAVKIIARKFSDNFKAKFEGKTADEVIAEIHLSTEQPAPEVPLPKAPEPQPEQKPVEQPAPKQHVDAVADGVTNSEPPTNDARFSAPKAMRSQDIGCYEQERNRLPLQVLVSYTTTMLETSMAGTIQTSGGRTLLS